MKKSMNHIFKIFIKAIFIITFIIFSLQSIFSFMKGEVIFENVNEYNEHLPFPSLTICPKVKEATVYLKTDQLATYLNTTNERSLNGKLIQLVLNHDTPLSLVKNYTFSKDEIFTTSRTNNKMM